MDEGNGRMFDERLQPIAGRDVAASLGPRPIAVIGARCGAEICFATVAWATPVSHTPPMVAFALRAKSRTFQLARESGRFSISVPDARLADAVNACGNKSGNTTCSPRRRSSSRARHTTRNGRLPRKSRRPRRSFGDLGGYL